METKYKENTNLNDYKDAVLYLMYLHFMDSRYDTNATFRDFKDQATVEYLNFIKKLVIRHKKNKIFNWSV